MLGMTWGHAIKCFAFLGPATLAAADARAGFTTVNLTPAAPEWSHAAILSHAYGGTFTADGLDFTNGTLTALREADFGNGVPAPSWEDDIGSARLLARFEGDEPSLDLLEGDRGASFRELFIASAALSGTDGKQNAPDPVVSYRLSRPDGGRKFLLFFEHVHPTEGGDRDYNDLVVEVAAGAGDDVAPPAAIPLPPAVLSALMVMLTGGLWNARASLQRWFTS